MVLVRMPWSMQICDIDIEMLFLILVSEIMMTVFEFKRESLNTLLRLQMYVFLISLSLQFTI